MTPTDDDIVRAIADGRCTVTKLIVTLYPDVPYWERTSKRTHLHRRMNRLEERGRVEKACPSHKGKRTIWRVCTGDLDKMV